MKTRFRHVFGLFAIALLLTTPSVAAQSSEAAAGTITVTTAGVASAPADSAMVVITIGPDTSYMPMPAEDTTEISAATAIATMDTPIDPTPVIEALVAAGVPVESIDVVEQPFSGEWGPAFGPLPVSLIFTLDQPDVAHLSDLMRVSREAAHANGWFINQFGVLYQVIDCRPLMQEARADAVANATTAAEDQAAAMGLTLGNPISSRDNANFNMGMPVAACAGAPNLYQTSRIYMATMFDPTLPAEVTVSVTVDVTFSAE